MIILLNFIKIKTNWFFGKEKKKKIKNNLSNNRPINNKMEFKRTSRNGDMTINPYARSNLSIEDNLLLDANNLNAIAENNNLLINAIRPRRTRTVQFAPIPNTNTNNIRPNTNTNNIRPNTNTNNIRPNTNTNNIRPNTNTNNIRPPDPVRVDILIPNTNNFAANNMFDVVFNDIAMAVQHMQMNEFNFIQHINDNNMHPIIVNNNAALMEILDQQIMDMLGIHRDNIINNRQNTATNNADTRAQAIDNYIDLATRQTNDAQNVHDHTVLAGFKLILERLIADHNELNIELKTLDEIKEEINKKGRRYSDNRPQLTLDALAVIERMRDGEKITALEIDGESTTDAFCLQMVWARAEHPLNSKNENLIKQSIFDNLLDSWEIDIFGAKKIVCVTGRATRMLGSLTLLDFDERNWEVKKFEDFKNEIFNRVKTIINEQAELATSSNNIDLQNAGKTYLAKTAEELNAITPPSDEAITSLNITIKQEISNMIANYVGSLESEFNTKIPAYMRTSVEKEAIASIDMF